jgi:hypothetical protein
VRSARKEQEDKARLDAILAENERQRAEKAERPTDHRALRPCPDCGAVRTVLVRYWRQHDGTYSEGRAKRCGVCEALARARHYTRLAKEWHEKAEELNARRGRHLQRRLGPR